MYLKEKTESQERMALDSKAKVLAAQSDVRVKQLVVHFHLNQHDDQMAEGVALHSHCSLDGN